MATCPACGAEALQDALCPACLARAGLSDAVATTARDGPSFAPKARAPERVGRVVLGFRVEALLGAGGMGEVFVARRPEDGARVVVKFAGPDVRADPRKRTRFRREGEALRRVGRHPGVVTIHAVLADEREADPCLVMELVEGTSVSSLLQRHGRLAPAAVARVGRDVAWGLAAVHGRGLLHRDIKPGNIIVTPDGGAKVVDFGIAKDAFATTLTAPGEFLGTGPYTAPERLSPGAEVDQRCDVFSLGATLYHAATGRKPFLGRTLQELCVQLAAGRYPRLREVVPEAPEALELVIAQMLATDPALRYETMRACAEDLERVLQGQRPRVVRLEDERGDAVPLALLERVVIGSAPTAEVRLDHPSVSPQHATLRREEGRFVLRDLKSKTGTLVRGELVRKARPLDDGDAIQVGELRLTFHGPRPRAAAEQPGVRVVAPPPVVQALAAIAAAPVALALLERLEPPAWRGEELAQLLGPDAAAAVTPRRAQRARELELQALGWLRRLAGDQGADACAWLTWWEGVQARAGPQVGPAAPPADLALRVEAGAGAATLRLGALPVTLGRDPRCELRLEGPGLARRHATVVALHGRLGVRDEGSDAGTLRNGERVRWAFLDPGDELALGEVRLRLVRAAPPSPGAEVDEATFAALEDLGHPAVALAQAQLLGAARDLAWLEPAIGRCPEPERVRAAVQAVYAERAQRARRALAALLGRDAGDDPAAWVRLLGDRGRQVRPAGWLP